MNKGKEARVFRRDKKILIASSNRSRGSGFDGGVVTRFMVAWCFQPCGASDLHAPSKSKSSRWKTLLQSDRYRKEVKRWKVVGDR